LFATLRAKLLLITAVTSLAMLILLQISVSRILLDRFNQLEEENVAQDIHRAQNELQDSYAELSNTLFDYAVWDETYNYMQTRDPSYIESNYTSLTFSENRINLLLILDNKNRPVFSRAYNLDANQEIPFPERWLSILISKEPYIHPLTPQTDDAWGLLMLPEGPMMIAIHDIVNSDKKGPGRGLFIIGRFLDSNEVATLANKSQVSMTIRRIDIAQDGLQDPRIKKAQELLSSDPQLPYIIEPLDENIIAGYTLLRDIDNNPALIMRVDIPRDLYHHGQTSVNYLTLAIIVVTIILGGAILFLQERVVLSRINQLRLGIHEVSELGAVGDFSARLHIQGHDELQRLSDTINTMLDTLENYQHQLLSQKRLFEDLVAVAHATVERPALDETLQNALTVARTLTDAERDSLFLLDENGAVVHSILAHEETQPTRRSTLIGKVMSTGLAGWVVRNRQPALVHDTDQDERWVAAPDTPPTRSALSVPIFTGERVSGILTLMHPQPGHFTLENMHLMQAAADQMALAIHNAQIYEEQRRLANRQSILYQVLRTVGDHLNPESVAHIAVETVANLTRWPIVTVLLIDDMTTHLNIHASAGAIALAPDMQIPITEGVVGRAFRDGTTQYIPDVRHEPLYIQINQVVEGSEVAVPLRRGKRILGVLNIENTRAHAFTPEDIHMAESMADAIALALDNARTHSGIRQYAANLNVVYALAWMISQSMVIEEMLPRALQTLISSLGFEAGIIGLSNPVTGRIEIVSKAGPPELLAQQFPADENTDILCDYVHRRRTTFVIGDIKKQIGVLRSLEIEAPDVLQRIQTWNMRAYVGTPLIHQQQSLGAFCLFTRQPHTFSAEDLALQMSIGQQIAAAVTNARLFHDVAEERRRLQAVIETSRDGIIFADGERGILVINAAAVTQLQFPGTPESWIGHSVSEFLMQLRHVAPGAARLALKQLRNLLQDPTQSVEGEFENAGHALQWVNLPVQTDSNTSGRLLVLHDVTEERLLERLRQDLIHTMVHDLRTPLTGIFGSLRLLKMNAHKSLTESQQQLLAIADNSTQRMLNLVNAILDIYRLENGQMPIHWESLPLKELTAGVIEAQSALAAEHQVTLECTVPADLPPAYGDCNLLRRVIENLVGNAVKFTPAGGRIKISARLDESEEEPQLRVSISDTGAGIPPEIRERLFQKFTTGQQAQRGSGLGLAFCKMTLEAHRQRIWVEHTGPEGTTFTFSLPLAPDTSPCL